MRTLAVVVLGLLAAAGPALAADGVVDGAVAGALSLLALGFVVGLAHALDADHVAAVAAMMSSGGSRRSMVARGMAWGIGHTLALFAICSTVVLLGLTISGRIEASLEFVVGVMIVFLGARVFWKLRRERVHIHIHEHDGDAHLHAHSHAGEHSDHFRSAHDHTHALRALAPSMGVGLVHGAAGSAGLLVLIVASAPSAGQAMLAFAIFGIGSMLGMAALTGIASYPLGYIHRSAVWMRTSLAVAIGALALFVGGSVILDSYQGLLAASL